MLNGEPLVGEPQDEEMEELDDITQEVYMQIFNPCLTADWRCVYAPRCAGKHGDIQVPRCVGSPETVVINGALYNCCMSSSLLQRPLASRWHTLF